MRSTRWFCPTCKSTLERLERAGLPIFQACFTCNTPMNYIGEIPPKLGQTQVTK